MKKHILFFSSLLITICLAFFTNSCYMGKNIEKAITVYIDDAAMNTQLNVMAQNPRYINYTTSDIYKEEFKKALLYEASYQKNITIVQQLPADYTLKINYFEIAESETKETVNDEKSPYNGQSYTLTNIDAKAAFDMVKDGKSLDSYTAYADKDEKLKNNQSLGQMITGSNKDNTEYREKLLQDDVCVDVAQKCGKRTWNLFTQKLAKKIK